VTKTVNTGRGGYKGGSRKGVPNKATANAREAIATFVDANAGLLQELLVEIRAKDGPSAAFRCITDLIEYHIPKLARHELTGNEGGPIVEKFIIEVHDGPPRLPE